MAVQRKSEQAHRPYNMGARLASIEETRERIAKATYELHATIGPGRTTISAIAERAGVQRHTVYAHFPDVTSLFQACTAHGLSVTEAPDPDVWRAIPDPEARVRTALDELYPYWRRNSRLYGNVVRDTASMPEAIEGQRQFFDLHETWVQAILGGWPDADRSPMLEVAVRHALDFGTWQSLAGHGLSDLEARDAMTAFILVMLRRPAGAATA